MRYIKFFHEIGMSDIALVGGKNASLGQMIQHLTPLGITIPDGFALTADAYWHHIDHNNLRSALQKLLKNIDSTSIAQLSKQAARIRHFISSAPLPDDIREELKTAYKKLSKQYHQDFCDVAVRSSATAEDLPQASFAGQQETYLNIHTLSALEKAVTNCMASLFTARAIVYRREHGFDDFAVALSVGVQKMVRAEKGTSGVMFTLDTETGFRDAIIITASYGLGENIVKGIVNPDEFVVHKPTLEQGFKSLIKKSLGTKTQRLVYAKNGSTKNRAVARAEQQKFCLTDEQIFLLAHQGLVIEKYYSALHKRWMPMDIEWAIDGTTQQIYIVQARPETVHHAQRSQQLKVYRFKKQPDAKSLLITGASVGQKIAQGTARVMTSLRQRNAFRDGDVIVTRMTDPDWVPLMKRASGIVTDLGGRTCHAAIVARELGIPAVIGTGTATKVITDGTALTIDCSQGSQGSVYAGQWQFTENVIELTSLPPAPVELMVNLADPQRAFEIASLPIDGVGLARLEFIITSMIKIHPMAIMQPENTNKRVRAIIKERTSAYASPQEFYIDTLAQSVGMIAAAMYPKPVVVRLTDFKSNEYRDLVGGSYFEPYEENPMLGFRGAVRYCSEYYATAFDLECLALKKVRDVMGFDNVVIMVPFVRTIKEAEQTIAILARHGLKRGVNNLKLYMMVEIPSNVLLIHEFAQLFDGFSIGSNDLTQLTLGVDRDSGLLSGLFDERDPAVKMMLALAIQGAHAKKVHIGICGQAPSDYPEIADFLIKQGIDSLSLNPDSVLPFLMHLKKS